MKLFLAVLLAAVLIGGFVGGELTDRTFSLTGAVVGGIGTAAILLGLGALFDAQARKNRDKDLPPEVRAVFDRMVGNAAPAPPPGGSRRAGKPPAPSSGPTKPLVDLDATIQALTANDAAAATRGEVRSRRLIPHHAIKRDVILAAYQKDFHVAIDGLSRLDWTKAQREQRHGELAQDFDQHTAGVNQLGPEDLDRIIALMKRTRTDLDVLEQDVRSRNPLYKIVDPL